MARSPPFPLDISGGFPHLRGDGPPARKSRPCTTLISPPAWGWPAVRGVAEACEHDFPTCVGMARGQCNRCCGRKGFPHLRGDGPHLIYFPRRCRGISPQAWGWPDYLVLFRSGGFDFPTCVGMAREQHQVGSDSVGFPHLRGDGPTDNLPALPAATISPPAWGWPVEIAAEVWAKPDFPTCVGMAP